MINTTQSWWLLIMQVVLRCKYQSKGLRYSNKLYGGDQERGHYLGL